MNKYSIEGSKPLNNFKYILKIMTITLFLLFFSILFSQAASSYSQETSFSLDVKSASIQEICEELEKKSSYRFIFAGNVKAVITKRVDLNVTSKNINEILNNILSNTGLTFKILEDQVVIYQDDVTNTSGAVEKILSQLTIAQQNTVRGTVVDQQGELLPGVTITIEGTTRGVITDVDGTYSINAEPTDKLIFSFVGMENQIIEVRNQSTIDVALFEKIDMLDEVTVVAFGTQKKESVIGSIETVRPADLKVPSSNLTTSLAGRISGLISYQRSGEPGQDDASFFVRGVTSFSYAAGPLILIDGVEMSSSDLARLQVDDIASFSIMKDAAATALYGARGANGVILVTTKEGREGKAAMSVRYETSVSTPTTNIELADPITYMQLNNEAVLARNKMTSVPYSYEKIDNTILGLNKYVYPANDWYGMLFNNQAVNHRLNFNVSGGGKVARYYIAGTFNQDNGILNVDKRNNFNNNIDLKKYLLRSNININVTPTTEAIVRLHGTFDDYTGPIDGGAAIYKKVMRSDPVLFPSYFEPDDPTSHVRHILFGNHDIGQYINPYADLVSGYKEYSQSLMMAQFELKQDLDFITEGLKLRGLFNTNRYSYFDVSRFYNPHWYTVGSYDKMKDKYTLVNINPSTATQWLSYEEGPKNISSTTYLEGALNYDRTFDEKHAISGLLVATMRNTLRPNASTLALSLPSRNMGVSGRFTYAFDNRYFSEFNFGYNGSERFSKDHRFGFFPSVGAAWIISNEPFWNQSNTNFISLLKLKATYGLVGNDAIGDMQDRFFYLSEVNLNNTGRSFTWGENFDHTVNGVSTSRYANENITWETSKKANYGIEVGFFNKINILMDYYTEHRKNILMTRADIPTTFGLQATPQTNVGEAKGSGIDLSADYNHSITKDLWVTGRFNFTYATAKYEVYEEVDNTFTPWLSKIGHPISQQWGYVAERLFIDDAEVMNSPRQIFSEYRGGDIKYRDINKDDQINELDMVPIGYPTQPEIIYGFGVSTGYKKIDFSFFLQGSARSSFWIDSYNTAPFIDTDGDPSIISKNALLKVYADNHWSEEDQDAFALWPRLSDSYLANNNQRSTWFMRDGSFLRLKSVEIGVSLPDKVINKIKLSNLRFYMSGTNLLTFSKFKLWDPEMAGNGLGYPIQKVYNIGFQVSF